MRICKFKRAGRVTRESAIAGRCRRQGPALNFLGSCMWFLSFFLANPQGSNMESYDESYVSSRGPRVTGKPTRSEICGALLRAPGPTILSNVDLNDIGRALSSAAEVGIPAARSCQVRAVEEQRPCRWITRLHCLCKCIWVVHKVQLLLEWCDGGRLLDRR